MQIIKKLILITVTILFAMSVLPKISCAAGTSSIISGADKFLQDSDDYRGRDLFNEENEKEGIDKLYYIMLSIGIVLTFLIGIILGIQFITSGVAGQAKVKEKLIPFALGAVVIFGAFGIWRLVYNLLNGFFN